MKLFGKKDPAKGGGGLGKGVGDMDVVMPDDPFGDVDGISDAPTLKADPAAAAADIDYADTQVDASVGADIREEILAEEEKRKPKKKKRIRKPKKKKVKGELTEAEQKELQSRLSDRVEIEHMPGMQKQDAIETALSWARDHARNPSNCYYNVMPVDNGGQNGYLVEIQEGVGRSYLPSVMKLAQDNPNRLVVVPMYRRKLTVFYSPKTGEFDAQILGEGVEPPVINGEESLVAKRGPSMTPVMKQHKQWLVTGAVTAAIGALSLLGSIAFYALDPETRVPPEWRTTDVTQLPVMQWPRLQSDDSGSYVVRMEFADNVWRVVRQDVSAQVDTVTVPGQEGVTIEGADGPIPVPADGVQSGSLAPGVPAPGEPVVPPANPPGVPPTIPSQGQ